MPNGYDYTNAELGRMIVDIKARLDHIDTGIDTNLANHRHRMNNIEQRLEAHRVLLDMKDRRIEQMSTRMDDFDKRLDSVHDAQVSDDAIKGFKKWMWTVSIAIATLLAGVIVNLWINLQQAPPPSP